MIISALATLTLELCEEGLEEAIAFGISLIAIKILSVIGIVFITQSIKFAIKKIAKLIFYKKGDDKMEKLKYFIRKLGEYFKANPITIGASAGNAVGSTAVGGFVYLAFKFFGWDLPDWAMYGIIAVVTVLIACLLEWGIIAKGWETTAEKAFRLAEKARLLEEKKIAAEAEAALKAQEEEAKRLEAEAQALIDAENAAQAAAEAEAQAIAKKAEHDALVAAKLAEIKAKANQ